MISSRILNSRRAQSTLEYLGIATLVILGILIMGPYVTRSINAHFKTLEDAAKDTHREEIKQAPPQNVTLPTCDCIQARTGCGTDSVLTNGQFCKVTQAVYDRTCAPLGCEVDMIHMGLFSGMQECRDEPYPSSCCTNWVDMDCGILGQNTTGGACANKTRKRIHYCGSPTPTLEKECYSDSTCIFHCDQRSPNANWCDPVNHDVNLLAPTTAVTYVDTGHCNDNSDMRCKAECVNNNYVSTGTGCMLHCGNGICEDGKDGRPNYGENLANCIKDCACPCSPIYFTTQDALYQGLFGISVQCGGASKIGLKVQPLFSGDGSYCIYGMSTTTYDNILPADAYGCGDTPGYIPYSPFAGMPDFIGGTGDSRAWYTLSGLGLNGFGYGADTTAFYNGLNTISLSFDRMLFRSPSLISVTWNADCSWSVCDPNVPGNPCSCNTDDPTAWCFVPQYCANTDYNLANYDPLPAQCLVNLTILPCSFHDGLNNTVVCTARTTVDPDPPPAPSPPQECFLAGTTILTESGEWKPIELISVGEVVIGRQGQANRVIGLHRPLLGNRALHSINGEVASTEDHLFMTASGKWGAIDPQNYESLRFMKPVDILDHEGKKTSYISSKVLPADVTKIEVGMSLELYDGTAKPVSSLEPVLGHAPETVLYTLVTDGNGSYTVQGGYVADAMPQK